MKTTKKKEKTKRNEESKRIEQEIESYIKGNVFGWTAVQHEELRIITAHPAYFSMEFCFER